MVGDAPADARLIEVWSIRLDQPQIVADAWRRSFGTARPSPAAIPDGDSGRDTAHRALRVLLARWIGPEPALAPFVRDPLGKPRPAAGGPAFSLSHSGDLALIALSDAGDVGVDVERPRAVRLPAARGGRIIEAARVAAPDVPLAGNDADDWTVLQAWVRLEAIAKASGEGMARLLTRIGVIGGGLDGGTPEPYLAGQGITTVRDLPLDGGYIGAIAGSAAVSDARVLAFPGFGPVLPVSRQVVVPPLSQ